ncbi:unnamed protein product [Bathycoccus prasinos]
MTNLIKKKERNDGFAESNASPPCVGHAFMNAKPDPDESFESCNDCGDSLNLGQRILNSKRVEGSKLCGRCHGRERKAWMNGEFDAHDGKKYEGKQRILTQSERREREREKLKHKKETNHVMFSRVLGRHVPINEYDNEIRKHWIENEHVVNSKALGGRDVPFGKYKNELGKHWKETGHMVESNALKRDVPFNEYDNEIRKHKKETGHMVESKALKRDVPFGKYKNVYGKLRKRVEKERILRMMQAHQSMNHSSCANSGCDCHVSPKWFTLSDMKNELILRCELAGITRTEEQFRRKLERMFTPVVSTAMKENEEMYFCLECKEKEFFKVGKRLQRVDEK